MEDMQKDLVKIRQSYAEVRCSAILRLVPVMSTTLSVSMSDDVVCREGVAVAMWVTMPVVVVWFPERGFEKVAIASLMVTISRAQTCW